MTLDELFGGSGLDERMEAIAPGVREGLEARLTVKPPLDPDGDVPTEGDDEPPEENSLLLTLTWYGQGAGALVWHWLEEEPRVLYWVAAQLSDTLRGTHLFGELAAELAAFFDSELGIEEIYARAPSDELKPILTAVGMVEVERQGRVGDPVMWGGTINRGRIREYVRFKRGLIEEPGWRTLGETNMEVVDDLAVNPEHLNGQPPAEPDPESGITPEPGGLLATGPE